jgi:uncharacterized RDD family membrane protein YckC
MKPDRPERAAAPAEISLQLMVETPENVVLSYQLAGPSIRCAAYVIDFLVRSGVMFALTMVLLCFLAPLLTGLSLGLWLLLLFLNEWGYYVICETFFRGKSFGKHVFGLRVIQDQGYPITFWSSLLRNLVRAADAFPLYGPALITMICSRKFKRLGDLVARTVVIQERHVHLPREPVILEKIRPLPREEVGSYIPNEQTLALIDQFLGRRNVLTHDRGHDLAAVLANVLARRLNYRGDAAQVAQYPMAFLARVYVTFIQTQNEDEEEVQKLRAARKRSIAGVVRQ